MSSVSSAVSRVAVVIPVAEMGAAVSLWEQLLGVSPTFVDGDRWAQFDTPSGRICLAGSDRSSDHTAALLKVTEGQLDSTCAAFAERGFTVGDLEEGAHERRCMVHDSRGGVVVLYEARGQ